MKVGWMNILDYEIVEIAFCYNVILLTLLLLRLLLLLLLLRLLLPIPLMTIIACNMHLTAISTFIRPSIK